MQMSALEVSKGTSGDTACTWDSRRTSWQFPQPHMNRVFSQTWEDIRHTRENGLKMHYPRPKQVLKFRPKCLKEADTFGPHRKSGLVGLKTSDKQTSHWTPKRLDLKARLEASDRFNVLPHQETIEINVAKVLSIHTHPLWGQQALLGMVGHTSKLSTRSLRLENYLEFEISYTVSTRPATAT